MIPDDLIFLEFDEDYIANSPTNSPGLHLSNRSPSPTQSIRGAILEAASPHTLNANLMIYDIALTFGRLSGYTMPDTTSSVIKQKRSQIQVATRVHWKQYHTCEVLVKSASSEVSQKSLSQLCACGLEDSCFKKIVHSYSIMYLQLRG
jgi:hypothetical protein